MNTDPTAAQPRADLPFLRRRTRPRPAPAHKIDYVRRDRAPKAPAAPPTSSLDLSESSESSAPSAPSESSAPPAPPAPKIDFSRRPDPKPATNSLDLSDEPAPARPATPSHPPPRVHRDKRVGAGEESLLAVRTPTVTLTRTQSGVGHLTVEAVCSDEVGDLRLGALYQLRSGGSSTLQHAGGHRFGPPSSRRPVLLATREEYERISVDLRQVRDIERIAIYAFSESRTELTWGGTLVVETFGAARIELPLDTLYAGPIAVLLSFYNFDGELVVRAEMENIAGDVREAARAYGYDKITWRDERSPVD